MRMFSILLSLPSLCFPHFPPFASLTPLPLLPSLPSPCFPHSPPFASLTPLPLLPSLPSPCFPHSPPFASLTPLPLLPSLPSLCFPHSPPFASFRTCTYKVLQINVICFYFSSFLQKWQKATTQRSRHIPTCIGVVCVW